MLKFYNRDKSFANEVVHQIYWNEFELYQLLNTLIDKRGVNVDAVKLVKKARRGDKEALLELIMGHKQDYYKLAYTYLGNREDALDAMEDMIVILYERIAYLKKPEAFYSWSKTILVNCCRKLLRKKKKLLKLDDVQEECSQCSQEAMGQIDQQITLDKHLAMLNDKQQEVLKLRYYMDLDYQGIAELLKIPLGTVKSRISNGLKKLAESLGGEGIE